MDLKGDRSGTRMRLTREQLYARGGWSSDLQGAASAVTAWSRDVESPMDTGCSFPAARHLQAIEYIVDVILDGGRAERETPRDLLIREALADQPDDLLLALS
jgi:hypothetical protein